MKKKCVPLHLSSSSGWHSFSYIFLYGKGTNRKTEMKKQLTPHEASSLSPVYNTGTNVQNAGHISAETANILPQMPNKLPKTKWNWIGPSLGPITILPIYCPRKTKIRVVTHIVSDLVSAGFLHWITQRSISIFGKTLQELLLYAYTCASFLNPETPMLQGNAIPPTVMTWESHLLWRTPHYDDLMSM